MMIFLHDAVERGVGYIVVSFLQYKTLRSACYVYVLQIPDEHIFSGV